MIPVTFDKLGQLIELPYVLMLDRNSRGVAYVDFLVRISPRHITSKKSHNQLPLELWGLGRRGTCDLVIPRSLGVNTDGIPTLFCQLLSSPRFGLLKHWDLARLYRQYLKLSEAKSPFGDLSTGGGTIIEVPVSCLTTRIPTLFSDVNVRDVIWCAEAGDCGLCGGNRTLRVLGDEGRLLGRYLDISTHMWEDTRALCPLCVGKRYFWESAELQEIDPRHEHLSPDEYDVWERRRLVKSGFDGQGRCPYLMTFDTPVQVGPGSIAHCRVPRDIDEIR
ncbi:hypothetical protein CEP54_006769 [Fusarium duplospermum]|uniref:Uncharacterized protein n=1 Tax=Fusarium duplospermum TaxID=1325734 RepID=A0A428Q573_9HYPO|nr:hypothetical protein CEP54_006769 [Fusarium duplospermum]